MYKLYKHAIVPLLFFGALLCFVIMSFAPYTNLFKFIALYSFIIPFCLAQPFMLFETWRCPKKHVGHLVLDVLYIVFLLVFYPVFMYFTRSTPDVRYEYFTMLFIAIPFFYWVMLISQVSKEANHIFEILFIIIIFLGLLRSILPFLIFKWHLFGNLFVGNINAEDDIYVSNYYTILVSSLIFAKNVSISVFVMFYMSMEIPRLENKQAGFEKFLP